MHLVLKGRVVVSNSTGNYSYFHLPEGAWFGESYLLFGLPSSYSYVYEKGQSVHTLRITAQKFLKICRRYPDSANLLIERGISRRRRFREYKTDFFDQFLDDMFT